MTPLTVIATATAYCAQKPPICRKAGYRCALEARVEFLEGGQASLVVTHRMVKEKGAEEIVIRPTFSIHYKGMSTQDFRIFLDNWDGWHKE